MARPPSDEQLLAAFLRGEDTMFAEIVRRYEAPLHAFICRLTGDAGEAPDLFQETFIRVAQHAGSFRAESRFKTWLYAIAANVCRSHLRQAKRRQSLSADAVPDEPDRGPGPNGAAASREIGQRIATAVGALPVEQREVFILKAYDELSYPEIARALGRPLGTVKSQMRLALTKLRVELREIAEAYGVAPPIPGEPS